ncbi:unnamed protein product [Amoebophrya sp. A25]|nr:unnamed protein product [Amoebophrya sp. A25]|eukprot:GSA25T00007415001.1
MDLFTRGRGAAGKRVLPVQSQQGPFDGYGAGVGPRPPVVVPPNNYVNSGKNVTSGDLMAAAGNAVQKPITDLALQSRVLDLEEQLLDLQTHLEKKFLAVEEDVNRRIDSKWEKFELWDKRFKEHIRGEQEVSQSQLLNLKSSGLEYILEKQGNERKIVNDMELKITAMDQKVGQVQVLIEKILGGDVFHLEDAPDAHKAYPISQRIGGIIANSANSALAGGDVGGGDLRNTPRLQIGGSSPSTSPTKQQRDRLLSSKLVRTASAGGGGGAGLNYNVAMEHMKQLIGQESEARQLLQEEMTENVKALHSDLRDFMQSQAREFLQDKKVKLQEEHDARILKLSEGSINSAFAQLKLELDVFNTHMASKDREYRQNLVNSEEKFLQNLNMATEQQGKNAKELWSAYIEMGTEWKNAIANLQQIIEHKSGILLEQIDRKIQNLNDLSDAHFLDQKKVNDALEGRVAKTEMVLLQETQKSETRGVRVEEEEKRWQREFQGLTNVLAHVKTKLAELGRTQETVEATLGKKVREEVLKGCDEIKGLATENFEKFSEQIERTKIFTEGVDKLNKENRRACTSELTNMETKTKASIAELTGTVTRLLQQAEFAQKALLSEKLEEEKEYVVGEIKAMERNNVEFRMQTHAKMDAVESSLIDRVLAVDRKCYDSLEAQKRWISKFERATTENMQKSKADTESMVKKHEVRTESRLNDQAMQMSRDIRDLWKKLDSEVKYMEKSTQEMMNKIKDHESSTSTELTNMREFWEQKFRRELDTTRAELSQKVQTLFEQERADRLKQEAERVEAMAKRFEAHESLNQRRIEELNMRVQGYCDTTDKRFEHFIKENEQLLTKKCDYLQDQIRSFRWDFDQERVRKEEERQDDLRDSIRWRTEVEAKQHATKYSYQKTLQSFLTMHLLEQTRDFEGMRRENKATAERMQRNVDVEKMERIKMVGETRAILEESDLREHANTRRSVDDNRRSLARELDELREVQDLENQKMQTETSKVASELGRKIQTETSERQEAMEAAIASLASVYHSQGQFEDWLNSDWVEMQAKLESGLAEVESQLKLTQSQILPPEIAAKMLAKVNKLPGNLAEQVQATLDQVIAQAQREMDQKEGKVSLKLGDLEQQVSEKLQSLATEMATALGKSQQQLTEAQDAQWRDYVRQEESKRFLRKEQDLLADSMTNKFLQGILGDTQSMKTRISMLEAALLSRAEEGTGIGLGSGGVDQGDEDKTTPRTSGRGQAGDQTPPVAQEGGAVLENDAGAAPAEGGVVGEADAADNAE